MGRHSSSTNHHHSPSSRRHRSHRSISPPPQRDTKHRYAEKQARTSSGSPDPPPRSRSRSRSPSPRTKRLKKAQLERESEKSHGESGRGRRSEREVAERKKEKRREADDRGDGDADGRNGRRSRSRHERSPEQERNGRNRHHRSQSPPSQHRRHDSAKPRDEVTNIRGAEQIFIEAKSFNESSIHASWSDDSPSTCAKSSFVEMHFRKAAFLYRLQGAGLAFIKHYTSGGPVSLIYLWHVARYDMLLNDEDDSISKMKAAEEALEEKTKQKPSFELSGKLAAETNRFRGVTLLFNEPPEARKPDIKWRLYVFKNGEVLNEPLYIHRQSCYLFGRERRVADIPTDHPSCSKQHAVIQFRIVPLNHNVIMNLGRRTPLNSVIVAENTYYYMRTQFSNCINLQIRSI
ncbi:hypothetical protein Ahy_B01g051494 [Arachis hypogaea]|uniref:FHA domain-containing protein n=1 Tax=Arachis hypogaea TaxID=3818 RepID=A0A445ALY8_ARAHY|nr:hypothetical protein Ahy_B01g051494 [Arachis hypogaea]